MVCNVTISYSSFFHSILCYIIEANTRRTISHLSRRVISGAAFIIIIYQHSSSCLLFNLLKGDKHDVETVALIIMIFIVPAHQSITQLNHPEV